MAMAASSSTSRRGADTKNPGIETMEVESSGLSQEIGSLHLAPPPGLAAASPADSDDATSSTDAHTFWLPATFMQDLFETAVLIHFEVVKAASAVASDHIGLRPKELLTGWPPVLKALTGLAYNFAGEDPWCRLGILPHAGQKPSELLIEQRFNVATTFLAASQSPTWTATDKAAAAVALTCLEKAHLTCLELLPAMLRSRARDPCLACPRWAEVGKEALQIVLHSAPCQDEVVATQVSDILGEMHTYTDDRILSPDAARDLTSRLGMDAVRALASIRASGLICWAPSEPSALGRLLSAFMQHAADDPHPRTLRLIVPMDTLPGCTSATGIMDLWSHPLLQDKWKAIVRRVEFTSQSLQIVQSGKTAPTTPTRTLMIATISASATFSPPSVLSVSAPLFQATRGHGIRVDCLVTDLMRVRRALALALCTRPLQWTDPARSPGSTATAGRVCLTGYFPPNEVTAMDLHMMFANLRNFHLPVTALVASEALFANNAAMIIEASDPAAAMQVVALCQEMAFVAPKTLTITSMADSATWEDKLERMFADDPSCFISKLRWRRSRNGGRTIAQPAATQRQMQASQRVATVSAAATKSTAEVVINGHLGHNGRQVVLQIIQVITDRGLVLQERCETTPSVEGSWLAVASSTTSGPAGRLQLHLSSEEELSLVRNLLHDKAFQLGSDMVSLSVLDDTALASQAKNGRRGARSRANPSGNAAPAR
jgi:hypothetical protein